MSNPILAVMLVTGEEIIGEVKIRVEKDDVMVFQKPRVVAILRDNSGRQGLGLVPWTKANLDSTVKIYKTQCVTEAYEPVQEVVAAYLQETSGIQLANTLPPTNDGKIIQ